MRGALDDLGEARRDQVVAQLHAVALGVALDVAADLVEPGLDAREQLDVPALRDEVARGRCARPCAFAFLYIRCM